MATSGSNILKQREIDGYFPHSKKSVGYRVLFQVTVVVASCCFYDYWEHSFNFFPFLSVSPSVQGRRGSEKIIPPGLGFIIALTISDVSFPFAGPPPDTSLEYSRSSSLLTLTSIPVDLGATKGGKKARISGTSSRYCIGKV